MEFLASCIESRTVPPQAYVSDSAMSDEGVIIAPFASIQALAKVAKNVAVNTQAIVGHHATVSEHVVISSQINLGRLQRLEPEAMW